jgi:predicted DNA-binding antitoxin AbrB/MazE fold protein
MTITVAAVYEGGGVLKLERPVDLKEKARVNVIIETDTETAATAEDDDPTGWKTARELIGSITEELAVSDASVNHDRYIYRRDR